MPDRAVLAARVDRLQDDQDTPGVLRGQPPLVFGEQSRAALQEPRPVFFLVQPAPVTWVEVLRQLHRGAGLDAQRPGEPGSPVSVLTGHPVPCPPPMLPAGVIDVHGRQVLHLLLGDRELDAVAGAGHRADRDSYFLAAPQVALLEEHMGHVVIAGVDEEALDPADVAVGGVDRFAAADLHLSQGNAVAGDGLLQECPRWQAAPSRAAPHAVVGPGEHLSRGVARRRLPLFGRKWVCSAQLEPGELRQGAAEPDLARRRRR